VLAWHANLASAASMTSIAVILYIVFCALTGVCGIHRRMGFIGTFLLTFVFTPPVVLIVLLLTGPAHRHLHRYR
jgi:hypothetical protein